MDCGLHREMIAANQRREAELALAAKRAEQQRSLTHELS